MIPLETDRLVPKKVVAGAVAKPVSMGMKLVASLKVGMVLATALIVAVYYLRTDMPSKALKLERGSKINIMSLGYQAYIGTNNDKVIITDGTPRVHSTTLEIFHNGGDCMRLRSLDGKWLRWDRATNTVKADSTTANQATQFEFVRQGSVTDQSLFFKDEYVQMKVCRQNLWWEVRTTTTLGSLDSVLEVVIVAKDPSKRNYNTRKLTTSKHKAAQQAAKKEPLHAKHTENTVPVEEDVPVKATSKKNKDHHGRELSKDPSNTAEDNLVQESQGQAQPQTQPQSQAQAQPQTQPQSQAQAQAQAASALPPRENYGGEGGLFRIEVVEPLRGVNLGGSFIPEIWMNPSFSNYTGLHWAGSLCNVVKFNRELAEAQMQAHQSSWLTERDFQEIAADGFNSVRLPVGYWNLIEDPYKLFVPADLTVSLRYIDWVFDMCAKYGLTVLLDLHGLPGSQNGIDHSGCSMEPAWLENADNIALTLQTIEVMAQRYGTRSNLMGIELANEPALKYCEKHLSAMVDVYQQAYHIIRKYSQTCKVVINELYESCYAAWKDQLREPEYYNVIIDLHLYNWQLPYTAQNAVTHVRNAVAWASTIDDINQHHPVIVGEWCFSTGTVVQAGQPFVEACVNSFDTGMGWYIWNWKIERNIHFDEWNVQLQYELPNGLRV